MTTLFHLEESLQIKKDLSKAPKQIIKSYLIWCKLVEEHGLAIFKKFKGYHDEKLYGVWNAYRSSRLNKKWRVIYKVSAFDEITIVRVEKVTPHDYRRK